MHGCLYLNTAGIQPPLPPAGEVGAGPAPAPAPALAPLPAALARDTSKVVTVPTAAPTRTNSIIAPGDATDPPWELLAAAPAAAAVVAPFVFWVTKKKRNKSGT